MSFLMAGSLREKQNMPRSTPRPPISEVLVSPDVARIYQKDSKWVPVSEYPASIEPEESELGMLADVGRDGVVKKIHRRIFCP